MWLHTIFIFDLLTWLTDSSIADSFSKISKFTYSISNLNNCKRKPSVKVVNKIPKPSKSDYRIMQLSCFHHGSTLESIGSTTKLSRARRITSGNFLEETFTTPLLSILYLYVYFEELAKLGSGIITLKLSA